jgi:hypothetical protein
MMNNIVPFQRPLSIYEEKLEYEWELLEMIEDSEENMNLLLDEIFLLGLQGDKLLGWLSSLRATQERLLGHKAELIFLDFDWQE